MQPFRLSAMELWGNQDLATKEVEDKADGDLVQRLQRIILVERRGAVFLSGLRTRRDSVAGSVARARAANVSVMILIQNNCTTVSTEVSSVEERR